MMPATIRRDAHKPQRCSGGKTALTCRNVTMLSAAAERDRSDPRVGTDSVMRMSQHKMVTFVNGNVRCVVSLGHHGDLVVEPQLGGHQVTGSSAMP